MDTAERRQIALYVAAVVGIIAVAWGQTVILLWAAAIAGLAVAATLWTRSALRGAERRVRVRARAGVRRRGDPSSGAHRQRQAVPAADRPAARALPARRVRRARHRPDRAAGPPAAAVDRRPERGGAASPGHRTHAAASTGSRASTSRSRTRSTWRRCVSESTLDQAAPGDARARASASPCGSCDGCRSARPPRPRGCSRIASISPACGTTSLATRCTTSTGGRRRTPARCRPSGTSRRARPRCCSRSTCPMASRSGTRSTRTPPRRRSAGRATSRARRSTPGGVTGLRRQHPPAQGSRAAPRPALGVARAASRCCSRRSPGMPNQPTSDLGPVLREMGRTAGAPHDGRRRLAAPGPVLRHEMAVAAPAGLRRDPPRAPRRRSRRRLG